MEKARKSIRKELVIGILIAVAIVGFIVWRVLSMVLYHRNHTFPDTNGDADFTLQTLTLGDILDEWYGSTMFASGSFGSGNQTDAKSEWWEEEDYDVRRMNAASFSGVTVLQATKVDSESLTLEITSEVTSGNFRIVITVDGGYYCDVEVNRTVQIVLENVRNKTVLVKLAGESAEFEASAERTY